MNIPSNYTIEEVAKYYPSAVPIELLQRLEAFLEEHNNLRQQVESFDRVEERLREQISFRDIYIETILEACKSTTKHKELVKTIQIELENSYIEL